MNPCQQLVAEFSARHELGADPATRLVDLHAETGELAKAYLEATVYGTKPFSRTENWNEELGDVLFALLFLANTTGVDAEAALRKVLAKYENRAAVSGNPGSDPA